MKKNLKIISTLALAAGLTSAAFGEGVLSIDFDDADGWVLDSAGITSYASDHVYSKSGWTFTGGPALRNTTSAQDGFAGAIGTYSWRLRDATVNWTATYTNSLAAEEFFSQFSFDARRWDGSPSPAYTVSYSLNGGSDWITATGIGSSGVLDNAAFGNSSDWSNFSQSLTPAAGLAANQFVVRFSATGGERIMVDNFSSVTAIPEPSTYAVIFGSLALGLVIIRRRLRR